VLPLDGVGVVDAQLGMAARQGLDGMAGLFGDPQLLGQRRDQFGVGHHAPRRGRGCRPQAWTGRRRPVWNGDHSTARRPTTSPAMVARGRRSGAATTLPGRTATDHARSMPGLVDVHSHAIPPALPALSSAGPGCWPVVERSGDQGAIFVGGRLFREIDSRCWSAPRRLDDLDADGVAVQVVSPVPVTFCYDAPPAGAVTLA